MIVGSGQQIGGSVESGAHVRVVLVPGAIVLLQNQCIGGHVEDHSLKLQQTTILLQPEAKFKKKKKKLPAYQGGLNEAFVYFPISTACAHSRRHKEAMIEVPVDDRPLTARLDYLHNFCHTLFYVVSGEISGENVGIETL